MQLAELMALHLHQLRKPALDHFSKLISLSGKAYFLEETLRQQRHTSRLALETVEVKMSYTHAYIHTRTHAYIHAYMHTYNTYIRTYVRTYVRTYIHTCDSAKLNWKTWHHSVPTALRGSGELRAGRRVEPLAIG